MHVFELAFINPESMPSFLGPQIRIYGGYRLRGGVRIAKDDRS